MRDRRGVCDVFTYKGEPYDRVYRKAWQNAQVRAGIENFRWHGLRHTLGELAGAEGRAAEGYSGDGRVAMVQRYAHLSPAHLAHRAKLLDGLIDTNSAQSPNP